MAAASTKILVVEDDEAVSKLLCRMLEHLNHRVLPTANAETALALFEHSEDRIDLVISDIGLPGMSGAWLADEIRRRDPTTPILLVSGHFQEHPDGFPRLEKPFTIERLEQRISEVMDTASESRLAPVPRHLHPA